jgi:hypothetical protein
MAGEPYFVNDQYAKFVVMVVVVDTQMTATEMET